MERDFRRGFSRRLCEALERSGMNQRQLADMIGVTEVSVCRWIKRNRTMSLEYLKPVCDVLDVSADWLIGRDG